jgi:hypothetical protein
MLESRHWRKKRMGLRTILRKKRAAFVLVLVLSPSFLSGSPGLRRFTFGVYGGWSLGLGYEFGWHTRPSRSDDYTLDAHLGAYVQYNLSAVIGIQGNVNYQHGTNPWTFTYPGFPYDEGTDRFHIFSANLNGIVTPLRLKRISFYIMGGGGISSGDFEDLSGTYFNLTVGGGMKIPLCKTNSGLVLNIGGNFVHLIDPDPYGSETADYLRFQIGLEF